MLYTAEFDEIEVTDAEGTDWKVAFTREVEYAIDPNYGADADGRNGERRVFIDDDLHTDTQVFYKDKWRAIELLHPSQRKLINAAIETWKQAHEPTIPDA